MYEYSILTILYFIIRFASVKFENIETFKQVHSYLLAEKVCSIYTWRL
jgi:hypothetical protein